MEPGLLLKLMSVLGLAVLELWAAIPAGLALGLHPILVAVASAFGSSLGAAAVILLGDRARDWVLRHRGGDADSSRGGWARRIWNRYGAAGLGLLSPLLFGAPLGAAIGVSLGADARWLLLWMALGIVIWSVLLTLSATVGLAGFERLLGH